jgi:MoxR-like ATPase
MKNEFKIALVEKCLTGPQEDEQVIVTTVSTIGKKVKPKEHKRKVYKEDGLEVFVLNNQVFKYVLDENNKYAVSVDFKRMLKKSTKKEADIKTDIVIPEVQKEEVQNEFKEDEQVRHEKYEEIKICIDEQIPIYLVGPAGSGKNFTLEQIAKDLDMNFYFANSIQQEHKLTGFIDAGGEYHETEFFKACNDDKPCIFFLDEMDASIPEVLVLLNAAIANGYFEFPLGKLDLNHVHFVAAGNTTGNGADEQYSGRMVIDQATLDRFAIIEFDYSRVVEVNLAKGDVELVEFIHQLRKLSEQQGIRTTFSYRCITMVVKLVDKMDLNKIIKIAVVKGLDLDTVRSLRPEGYTKYHKALKEVQRDYKVG